VKGKNGKFIKQTFHNIEDVWDVIWLLKKETIENSKGAESISIAGSVSTQLPFFCCPNNIIDVSHSSIISKYFYCKEFTVSPFKGSYGDTPSRWIQQVSIIKNAVGIIERRAANKSKNKG
tara:strand:+ start:519 stop:878 length:360 start_codon:yes stop_codon:yes gene_type:complete